MVQVPVKQQVRWESSRREGEGEQIEGNVEQQQVTRTPTDSTRDLKRALEHPTTLPSQRSPCATLPLLLPIASLFYSRCLSPHVLQTSPRLPLRPLPPLSLPPPRPPPQPQPQLQRAPSSPSNPPAFLSVPPRLGPQRRAPPPLLLLPTARNAKKERRTTSPILTLILNLRRSPSEAEHEAEEAVEDLLQALQALEEEEAEERGVRASTAETATVLSTLAPEGDVSTPTTTATAAPGLLPVVDLVAAARVSSAVQEEGGV